MVDQPEELMSGLDSPRALPPQLRSRLEAALSGDGAREVPPELADALAEALTRDGSGDPVAEMLGGLDGARDVPPAARSRLEVALTRSGVPVGRRRRANVGWLAGVAAACLLAAGIGLSTVGHAPHTHPAANPGAAASNQTPRASAIPGPVAVGPESAQVSGSAPPTAARPSVSSVSPRSGPAAGATVVTIMGSGFGGATAVHFGHVEALRFTVVSAHEIRAVSPAEPAGTVDVTVTLIPATSATGPGDRFTYEG